jgi:uncharacterized protein YbcC (UPF0753/DUF2309 family)
MKKKDLPQDKGALQNFTREVCYVQKEDGSYEAALSEGWEVKSTALDKAWEEIHRRTEDARQKVLNGEASPVVYYLEKHLMDLPVLAGYTGFRRWQIKRHMKPSVFKRLSDTKLRKYAEVFEVSFEDFKQLKLL